MQSEVFKLLIKLSLAGILGAHYGPLLTENFRLLPVKEFLVWLASEEGLEWASPVFWALVFLALINLALSIVGFFVGGDAGRYSATKISRHAQNFFAELALFCIFSLLPPAVLTVTGFLDSVIADDSFETTASAIVKKKITAQNERLAGLEKRVGERRNALNRIKNDYKGHIQQYGPKQGDTLLVEPRFLDIEHELPTLKQSVGAGCNPPGSTAYCEGREFLLLSERLSSLRENYSAESAAFNAAKKSYDDARASALDEEAIRAAANLDLAQFRDADDPLQGAVDAAAHHFEIRTSPQELKSSFGAGTFWKEFGLVFQRYWVLCILAGLLLFAALHTGLKGSFGRLATRFFRLKDEGRFGFGGSGRFSGLFEEWALQYGPRHLFVGRSLFNPFTMIGLKDEAHMMTIAGSRAGKGATAIIPNLLLWEGSAVVIDPKGTNAAVTAAHRRDMGQDVHIVDPFGIVKNEQSASFNPLEGLDPASPMIREKIGIIADALVVPDPEAKETHWDDGARTILSGLIGHLISSGDYASPTLPMIRDLLNKMPEEQVELWADMSLNPGAGGASKDASSRILRGINTNEILSLLSNTDKHTEWLSSPVMQNAISSSSFKFSDVKARPTTIYLVLPPEQLKRHNRFLRLFVNLMISEMPVGGRSKIPVLMILDEFLALGRMKEIEEAFAVMASYNLILWPFIQDLARLKELYKESVNAFVTNSRAVQVFGVSDQVTTEFVSQRLGNRPLKDLKNIARNNETAPLRSTDDVAKDIAAKYGRQYILRAGEPALLLEKVPYFHGSPLSTFLKKNPKSGPFKGPFEGKYSPDPDFS